MVIWSDLPPEILHQISGKLEFYEDLISFLCVCTSWRASATRNENQSRTQHLPSRSPCLMLPEPETDHYRPLFLLSGNGTFRRAHLPEARAQRCISAHGWLLTTGAVEFAAKLLHPLSRVQIDLPELYTFGEYYFDEDEWMYYAHCIKKAAFTSPNPLYPSFCVAIIWGRTLGFCRIGDHSWTRIHGSEGGLLDITYHGSRKRLYAVATTGAVYECDFFKGGSCPLALRRLTTTGFGSSSGPSAYLLEWGHDGLLVVTRERECYKKGSDDYGRFGPYRTKRFHAFLLGLEDGKWSKVESLGDRAVFLGFNSSFAIDACGDVKRECIYFTDDLYEPYRGVPTDGGRDVGVYHMSDGTIEAIFDARGSGVDVISPLWLQPSIRPPINQM